MRELIYHDEPGAPSPREYIDGLEPEETANIDLKFEKMRELPYVQWPPKWKKVIEGDLRQLRSGDHRILYFVPPDEIVVVHAVRKRGRKLKPRDKNLSLRRIENYREKYKK